MILVRFTFAEKIQSYTEKKNRIFKDPAGH